jgi:hypothetical protein
VIIRVLAKRFVLGPNCFVIMTHCKERTMSMAEPMWFCVLVVFGAVTAASTEGFAQQRSRVRIEGQVQTGGGPLANSTVTLWAASAGEPKQLVQTKSGSDGRFELRAADTPGKDVVLYVVAKGGIATVNKGSGDNPATALLTVLGNQPPAKIVINELTTVASTFTSARFIKGEAISGNPLGLRIAAGNAPNLVDPATGGWGKVLLDPLNSSMTTTLAKLDTLGSLITYATVANDDWRARFFKAATPTGGVTPKNTLEAMAGIAHEPWAAPKELYGLYNEAYPQWCALRAVSGLRSGRLRSLASLLGRRRLCQRTFHV